MEDLKFKFIGYEPCSTNDMYIPTARGYSRKGAFLRRSDKLIQWQDLVQKAYNEEVFYTKEYLKNVSKEINSKNLGLEFDLQVSMPENDYWFKNHNLKKNDASNYIKAIEDSICSIVGYDDSHNTVVHIVKGYNKDGIWKIEVTIKENILDRKLEILNEGGYINGSISARDD